MRIVLVNNSDYGGGAENVVRLLRDGLRAHGHETTLWVGRRRSREDPTFTRALPATDAEHRSAQRYALKGYFGLGVVSSDRFVESGVLAEFDLLHLHNLHGHYFSIPAISRLARLLPLVWTSHDFFPITGGCVFPYDCDRWMTRCGRCPQMGRYPIGPHVDRTRRLHSIKRKYFRDLPVTIISPSRHLADAVRRSGTFERAEIHIIPYGVDTDLFKPGRHGARQQLGISHEDRVVLLMAPRLNDPRKGIVDAVKALRQIDLPGLTILVVGAGEPRPFIDALPQDEIRPLGYIKDRPVLANCCAAADLFLFTSLAENYPCAVQEAMAAGTVVLAFDINGVNEQIVSRKTGFLVPPRDTETLAQTARDLLENRSLLHDVGESARRHACSEWTLEQFLDRHETLYRNVVAQAGRFNCPP